jgi:predicted nucleic acid-binding protein
MDVVLDSHVLFRTLISGGKILELFFNKDLTIFAPERLQEEFLKNKEEILVKSSFSPEEFNELAFLLFKRINFVSLNEYKVFIPEAKKLLGDHDKDEDFIALCLMKDIKLWTYEKLLFDIKFGISTSDISHQLDAFM